jgi:hypothetical protein
MALCPFFYPFPDVKRTTSELDAPSFARREKLHRFAIHQPYLLQVKSDGRSLGFRYDQILQLAQVPLIDPTA